MKHYLLQKLTIKQSDPFNHFYLWDILADGIIERLKRIKLAAKSVAWIGPSSSKVAAYLQSNYPDVELKIFTTAWALEKQHYDLVIINGILSWFQAPGALIEDVYASLNPKGLLLLSTLGPETLVSLQKAAVEMGWQPRLDALVDMHHWGDCLLKTGFLDPVMDREDIHIRFKSPKDWFTDWRALGLQDPSEPACSHLITPKQWQKFVNIAHSDNQNPWEARFECLFGHAYKPKIPKQKQTAEGVIVSLESLKKTLPSSGG
jgi:SAM-dependent methyltransferase